MKKLPQSLLAKIKSREQKNALRQLGSPNGLIDFASNDYLGFSKSEIIFDTTHDYLVTSNCKLNGASGSRLLTGNHFIFQEAENSIAHFHESETALVFNSGYDANVGFFNAVPQRNDFILYDELSHASIRDGIIMSTAKSYKFSHNDLEDLERLILFCKTELVEVYIVTESVFSMDGDSPRLEELVHLSEKYNCHLVIDEAHALGVYGEKGEGLIQMLKLQDRIFARIMTFGKGLGCHGAMVLGSNELKSYLVNFARSFIYTTGLSPHAVATILVSYQHLEKDKNALESLKENIIFFNKVKKMLYLNPLFIRSKSAIQSAIIPGNEKVKGIANALQKKGFDVKAILSPTVPEGQERLRICLHSYNTEKEISEVLQLLSNFVFK